MILWNKNGSAWTAHTDKFNFDIYRMVGEGPGTFLWSVFRADQSEVTRGNASTLDEAMNAVERAAKDMEARK